jgi:predicted dehydrogenase
MQTNIPTAPVRLALVGAGIFMQDAHVPSLLRQRERFEIVAVYSRSEASAAKLAQQLPHPVRIFTDYGALLADPTIEAVDIVLPIPVIGNYIAEALTAGKAVISEKPIAVDSTTARKLLDIHRIHPGQPWMVGENWRYETAFVEAAAIVRSGQIGAPVTVHWAIYTPVLPGSKYYGSVWRESGELPGGYLLDGGVHHVAALRLLVSEIQTVSATVKQVEPRLHPADTLAAQLQFANGAVGTYLVSYGVGAPWPPYLFVVGERGALRVQRGEVEVTMDGQTQRHTFPKFDGVENELIAFAQSVRSGVPHANSPEEALRDLTVVEALLQAAEQGRVVTVEQE